jgi:hypothetical protein
MHAIFYVDASKTRDWLSAHGANIIDGPRNMTAGKNLTARYPGGLVVEYFAAGR